MSKKLIVESLRESANITKKRAGELYDQIMEILSEKILNGEKVALRGVGSFKIVDRKARKGVNPRTKEPLNIAARKAVVFKSCSRIKKAVNS